MNPTRIGTGPIASRLPPTLNALFEAGELSASTPGLVELTSLFPEDLYRFEVKADRRLELASWPLWNEATLACWAMGLHSPVPSRLQPHVDEARRWLGVYSKEAKANLAESWRACMTFQLASDCRAPRDQVRELLSRIFNEATGGWEEVLDEAYENPIDDAASLKLVCLLTQCALCSVEGWLSYYVHRGLAPGAVLACGDLLLELASTRGRAFWGEVVEEEGRIARDWYK